MTAPTLPMLALLAKQGDTDALRKVLEADFSKAIVAYATQQGWLSHYERRSGHKGQDGTWRGSGPKGKPDLTLVRDGVVLLCELKRETTYPTVAQREWLAALGDFGRLWRPRDASDAMRELE
jgi:hypothetical protein